MSRMTPKRSLTAVVSLAVLAGCGPLPGPDVTKLISPTHITATDMKPPADMPGVCWGHIPGPQITQIVTDIVVATPAQTGPNGEELSPAIYREVTRPQTFNEGDGRWFTRTCDADMTPEFVMTLQRALSARGIYRGDINGVMDQRTLRAVHEYQTPQGLDSAILSQSAAQQLGLIAVELEIPATNDG
ncbi:putative peptidoglycan binding protein [Litoreibacter halocynthiae]|uniref:Putative peptidoglycan binding protein n=1 Tax=Litoreibacter halocynthiae TaxID=1242689 RepID=A0A4R7LHU5_9RHOB|nr:peptidoglycan-binding domain-containing protein [Litoreibacter halocynthiae]TDT74819.1 putative peptidoglycan binding protein [Litoreibacter halocynthiae]